MAIAATCVWEVRTSGADTNGGGFVAGLGGTDRSLQAAAQVVIDNSTITCTTPAANSNTLTFVSGYTPSAADTGNVVQITAGTNMNAGFYEITGQTATTWTLTGATNLTGAGGAGSAITGNMGGALASLGKTGAGAVAGNTIFVLQAGSTYSVTTATNNVAGGTFSVSVAVNIYGYTSNRTPTNTDTRPTLQAAASTMTMLKINANGGVVANLILDGNSGGGFTAVQGISFPSSVAYAYNCKGINCTNSAFTGAGGVFVNCEASGCSTAAPFLTSAACIGCESHGNTVTGFSASAAQVWINCLAYANSGGSSTGFTVSARNCVMVSCTAYGNGSNGFSLASNVTTLIGCIAEGNTGAGFANTAGSLMIGCFAFNNTGGNSSSTNGLSSLDTTAASSFFVNAAGGNFALNATALAGAIARAASKALNAFPAGTTVGYTDAGAAQHQDSGGAAGIIVHPGMCGGMRG